MLKFASVYREPINKITGDRSMKIRQYEIKDEEWTIVEQLRDCLKVRTFILAIRAALKLGTRLLNKYYSLTDDSEVYRIAMG
jgi:hypothetical protein